MSNINLSTKSVLKKTSDPIGKSLIFTATILIVLIILYVVLIVVNRGVNSKINSVKAEYDIEYKKLLDGNSNEIIDFKNRSDIAGKMLTEDLNMTDVLAHIESSILPTVYLSSFDYSKENNTLSVVCIGGDFQTVAKQVLSFKQDEYFSSVLLRDSRLDVENLNSVVFDIDLKIK
jgi:hypothetical protein